MKMAALRGKGFVHDSEQTGTESANDFMNV
jgi:hypothetical protein